jgi:hypothetical protein
VTPDWYSCGSCGQPVTRDGGLDGSCAACHQQAPLRDMKRGQRGTRGSYRCAEPEPCLRRHAVILNAARAYCAARSGYDGPYAPGGREAHIRSDAESTAREPWFAAAVCSVMADMAKLMPAGQEDARESGMRAQVASAPDRGGIESGT